MKRLFILFLLAAGSAFAQDSTVATLAANTVANALSTAPALNEIRIINTNAGAITVKFYDVATATTNIIRPAYKSITSYNTNYSILVTNFGVITTNSFTGTVRAVVSNASVTNELSRLATIAVPGAGTHTFTPNFSIVNGLTLLSTGTATVQIDHD